MQSVIGVLNLSERQIKKILRNRSKNKNKKIRYLDHRRLEIKKQFVDYLCNMKNIPNTDLDELAEKLSLSASATTALEKNKPRSLATVIRNLTK